MTKRKVSVIIAYNDGKKGPWGLFLRGEIWNEGENKK